MTDPTPLPLVLRWTIQGYSSEPLSRSRQAQQAARLTRLVSGYPVPLHTEQTNRVK